MPGRQIAIASAGRTGSTSLFNSLVATLGTRGRIYPIWTYSPGPMLAEAYAAEDDGHIIVKSETFHFLSMLKRREHTTLVLLSRRDQVRQVVSHIVSLRSGRFFDDSGESGPVEPFAIDRHEFLSIAYMVLMMETHFRTIDRYGFDRVEHWMFEDMVADMPGHLLRLGIEQPTISNRMGVSYDSNTVLNLDEVHFWASSMVREGLRGAMVQV